MASKKAPYGWTVVARGGDRKVIVYKRDCPATAAHFAADLAPFTHDTKREAVAAGKRGEFKRY
jgi:hypothetical protein